MNERIKELMDQARDETTKGISFDTGLSSYSKRFAELIIEESIKVMKENDYHGGWLGEKVKEHFGVEE